MVFEKVKSIILSQFPNFNESLITMNASFTDDIGADSVDVIELILKFEEEFDIEIDDEQLETIKTVSDVVSYIESL